MKRELTKIRGRSVWLEDNPLTISFEAGATIDGDGGYRTYCPPGASTVGLDYLANAGEPGNWFGVLTDRGGRPIVQQTGDPFPGCYVSTTRYQRPGFSPSNPRRYLDSEKELFAVIPGPLIRMVAPVVIGCLIIATYGSKAVSGVCGDSGPATHLGEISIAMAKALGIPSSPENGGVASGVSYRFFPGVAAHGYELQPA